ncbi:hypothetical protein Hhel01_01598 [Haloferula helveola]
MIGKRLLLLGSASVCVAVAGVLALGHRQGESRAAEARHEGLREARNDRWDRPVGDVDISERRMERTLRGAHPGEGSLASKSARPFEVTVGGNVRTPGPVEIRPGQVIGEAIAAAGGANEFGAIQRVRLYRAGKVYEYDLSQEAPPAIFLQPEDVIKVPQKMVLGR